MQVEKREAWSGRQADTQELCRVGPRDAGARWMHGTAGVASLPAYIPFVFRHCSVDDASPWHFYMLQYRAEYTYRRLGLTTTSDSTSSDSCATRRPLRDASERYSADNMTDCRALTTCKRTQSEPVVMSQRRAGHRSAPASFVHVAGTHQRGRVADDDDSVSVTTVSLQLSPPHPTADHQPPSAKSLLRCPAIRIHMNGSSSTAPAAGQSSITSQTSAPQPPPSSLLPRVVIECADSRTQQLQQQLVSSAGTTSDSYTSFIGRTMRQVPSNGFSIDDHTMSVFSLSSYRTFLHCIDRGPSKCGISVLTVILN